MDAKTRQNYLQFLEFIVESDLEKLNESGFQKLKEVADSILESTELHPTATQRIDNAIRFAKAAESGSAQYEIQCLVKNVRQRLDF